MLVIGRIGYFPWAGAVRADGWRQAYALRTSVCQLDSAVTFEHPIHGAGVRHGAMSAWPMSDRTLQGHAVPVMPVKLFWVARSPRHKSLIYSLVKSSIVRALVFIDTSAMIQNHPGLVWNIGARIEEKTMNKDDTSVVGYRGQRIFNPDEIAYLRKWILGAAHWQLRIAGRSLSVPDRGLFVSNPITTLGVMIIGARQLACCTTTMVPTAH